MQIAQINSSNNTNNFKAKMIVSAVSNFYHPISSINASYKKLSDGEKKDIVQLVEELYNMARDKEIFADFPHYFFICPANTYKNYVESAGPIHTDESVMIDPSNMCWSRDSWDLKKLFNQIKGILKKYDTNPTPIDDTNVVVPEQLTSHDFFVDKERI